MQEIILLGGGALVIRQKQGASGQAVPVVSQDARRVTPETGHYRNSSVGWKVVLEGFGGEQE